MNLPGSNAPLTAGLCGGCYSRKDEDSLLCSYEAMKPRSTPCPGHDRNTKRGFGASSRPDPREDLFSRNTLFGQSQRLALAAPSGLDGLPWTSSGAFGPCGRRSPTTPLYGKRSQGNRDQDQPLRGLQGCCRDADQLLEGDISGPPFLPKRANAKKMQRRLDPFYAINGINGD